MSFTVRSRSLRRAQWYGELISTLEEAEQLLLLLEADRSMSSETNWLCLRVAAVRSKVEALNRIRHPDDRIVGVPWCNAGRSV